MNKYKIYFLSDNIISKIKKINDGILLLETNGCEKIDVKFGKENGVEYAAFYWNGPVWEKLKDTDGDWISTKDELPQTEDEVIFVCKGERYLGWYEGLGNNFVLADMSVIDADKVSYWMPAPNLPNN